jgi:hypothetical protein
MNSSPNYSTTEIFTLLELNDHELDSTQVTNPQEIVTDLLTNDVNEISDNPSSPNQKKPSKPFSKNPYVKLGLIAIVVGSVAIFFGLLFAQGSSIYSSFSNNSASKDSEKPGLKKTENPSSSTDTLEERNAKLSGELALSEQNEQIKAIRDKLDNGADTPKVTIDKGETPTRPSSTPPPVVRQAPPAVVHQAKPQPVSRFAPRFTSGISRVRQPQPPSSIIPSNSSSLDPIEASASLSLKQWQMLAQLGSYGGGQQVNQVLANQPKNQPPSPELSDDKILTSEPLPQSILVASSTGASLQLGQKAAAILATSIAVPIDLRNTNQEFIFTVTLSEPLKTHQGETALEKGSTVVFAVQSVQNGIISSRAVAVINEGQEYPVDADALQIRLSNGSPLIAQLKDNYSGEIARRDGATFVMGALSQAGELANRATSTSTFSGIGGVSSTSTYNQPNYIGAVLEGGFTPLAEQWQQRNQQAIREIQNLSRLWWVDAGIPVQVLVTRSINLEQFSSQGRKHQS